MTGRPGLGGALHLRDDGRAPRELLGGVTLAALALPLNIGYATAAGLPATVGIYATLIPLVIFAITTGSRHLVVGPDATIAALLAAVLAPLVATGVDPAEAAWASSLMVGAVLLGFWAFRLGSLVRFVSKPVLVGFIAGLGVKVLTSQIAKIMAVSVDGEHWPTQVSELVRSIPDASATSAAVGVATIVALRLLQRLMPRLPGALVVLAVATVVVAVVEPGGVEVLGEIPAGLPAPTFPTLGLDVWLDLAAVAIAIAVLTTAEGALLAQRYARRDGERVDANGELFAFGASNVSAAVTGAMPIGASASRTAALSAAGTRTQVPAVVAAIVVALVVLFFTDVVAELPEAALAALVASAVVSTIEVREIRRFGRLRRSELGIAMGCAAGVLVIGPIGGIVLAVLVSAIDVVRRVAAAPWTELAGEVDEPALGRARAAAPDGAPGGGRDGLRMVRPGGPLFFANADRTREVLEELAADPDVEWIVIDAEQVGDVDPTAAEALVEGIDAARAQGVTVAITRATRPVTALLERYGIVDAIGREHLYDSNRRARAAFEAEHPPDTGP